MSKTYTFCEDTVSDLFKDVYGMRPGEGFWQRWAEATDDEKQEQWDWLIQCLDRVMREEAFAKERAIANFEDLVSKTIESGAGDRETALRWIMQGSSHANGDWEFLCYEYGLPYHYFRKAA